MSRPPNARAERARLDALQAARDDLAQVDDSLARFDAVQARASREARATAERLGTRRQLTLRRARLSLQVVRLARGAAAGNGRKACEEG